MSEGTGGEKAPSIPSDLDGILAVIREEIAQLTRRIPELERERTELSAEAARLDSECVLAKIAGEAPSAKQQKQLHDNERSLGLIDEAIRVAKARRDELAGLEQAEIQTRRWESQANELLVSADAMPAIIDRLNEVVAIVERSATGERRAMILADIGSALRDAVHASNLDRPHGMSAKLTASADLYRKSAGQRLGGQPMFARPGPPLARDTPIYVRKSIRWKDMGDPVVASFGAFAGALIEVPKAVADAAVRIGAAVIVETKHVRVELKRGFTQEDERGRRTWKAGFAGNVACSIAQEMVKAGAVDQHAAHLAITEIDVKELRAKYPELQRTNEVDLGAFNECRVDGERSLAEIADDPGAKTSTTGTRTHSLARLTA
ncbi:hypothetical protein [Hyphomicrobium sp. LHD-15]|uniref:hypothetical protein n=1 Tax=Hyphomicrobium sp. LHD-15 TaxID=3072142 RepID=UPI00280C4FE9|nr:hypothetical protein [Hyphomicrobium sp. LHD-15]MDQ8700222.1 hypothetical protein [Hyphomicrobium sp. LHD-15]